MKEITKTNMEGITAFCDMRIEVWSFMRISNENYLLVKQKPTEGGECAYSKTYFKHEVLKDLNLLEFFGEKSLKEFLLIT